MVDTNSFDPCGHPDNFVSLPRVRSASNGVNHYLRQCLNCGSIVGQFVPKNIALQETNGNPEPFDQEFLDRYRGMSLKEKDPKTYEILMSKLREYYSIDYDQYLLSDGWREKRQKVFKRCGGICEGCGDKPATQVHHYTYKNLGDEFLFQLAGVCDFCHVRIHETNPKGGILHTLGNLIEYERKTGKEYKKIKNDIIEI